MSFLASWISNIIVFVLLATVIDMLLPSASFQKYTKMVIGLLLIAVMITPILHLFQTDFEQLLAAATTSLTPNDQNNLENVTELKKKEIQAVQSAYILEQLADQLKGEVKDELMENYHMNIEVMDVAVMNEANPTLPDDLQTISISLTEIQDEETIETIAKVDIQTKTSPKPKQTDYAEVKRFLAKSWSIDTEMIQIAGERRD